MVAACNSRRILILPQSRHCRLMLLLCASLHVPLQHLLLLLRARLPPRRRSAVLLLRVGSGTAQAHLAVPQRRQFGREGAPRDEESSGGAEEKGEAERAVWRETQQRSQKQGCVEKEKRSSDTDVEAANRTIPRPPRVCTRRHARCLTCGTAAVAAPRFVLWSLIEARPRRPRGCIAVTPGKRVSRLRHGLARCAGRAGQVAIR